MLSRDATAIRRNPKVVIVGAGFSGVAMALELNRAGHDNYLIVDAADEFGGTWRDNTYPGCACDVPSPVYSLDGEPHDWPRFFAPQPAIQAYILRVVAKHRLRHKARLSCPVVEQRWDESDARWHLTTGDGDTIVADVVINAVGPLSRPVIPEVPGVDRFAGPMFHTAQWRHDVPLADARVGVIGTGASAVQVVPEIVDEVGHLTVFQRTPSWVVPKPDREFSPAERFLLRRVPGVHRLVRGLTNQVLERVVWRMLARDERVVERVRRAGTWNIERAIDDPELRRKVTPGIEPGCKRLLLSNTYYPALARDHVDVRTGGVVEITHGGAVTAGGEAVDLDVIIWGTGFDPHHFWLPMRVVGSDGIDLREAWERRPAALNAVATPELPNSFFLLGPNSGTGHNSVILVAEAQAAYIASAIRHLAGSTADWMAPTDAATQAWTDDVAQRHTDLVWATGCASWYLNDDGVNDTLYPGTVTEYRRRVARFDPTDFDRGQRGAVPRHASPQMTA